MCKVKKAFHTVPIRENSKVFLKWKVTLEEYPFSKYPISCIGPIYIMSR